jgi:hypothetical protein
MKPKAKELPQALKDFIVNNPNAKIRISIRKAEAKARSIEKTSTKSKLSPIESRALSKNINF